MISSPTTRRSVASGATSVATATSDDGPDRARSSAPTAFALGVQWYPEADERGVALAQTLVDAALPPAA